MFNKLKKNVTLEGLHEKILSKLPGDSRQYVLARTAELCEKEGCSKPWSYSEAMTEQRLNVLGNFLNNDDPTIRAEYDKVKGWCFLCILEHPAVYPECDKKMKVMMKMLRRLP